MNEYEPTSTDNKLQNPPILSINETKQYKCVGIDGTKGGWLAACLVNGIVNVKIYSTINELCSENCDADSIIIDIPIGLPENNIDIRPDKELRKYLKGKTSSVFPTPCRQAVNINDKQKAKEKNINVLGKSLSEQSLAICGKIKETDDFLCNNTEWINRLVESHPEFIFMILNDGFPIIENKKTKNGIDKRLSILRKYINNIDYIINEMSSQKGMKKRVDDIIDAASLAVIGKLGIINGFRTIPENPRKDNRSIKMQIVFADIC